jgi:hypothetical protein
MDSKRFIFIFKSMSMYVIIPNIEMKYHLKRCNL